MKMNNLQYILILCIAVLISSCASSEKIIYFQDVDGLAVVEDSFVNFEPAIQVGDMLAINISAIDAEAAIPFNLYESPMVGNGAANAKPIDYLVDAAGDIHFPVIGKLKVAGLTTKEFNKKLSAILSDYIKKPIINIRLMNFKVTVLGQVKSPGTYTIPNERVSIIEAIGLAGDLEIHGKRKNVTLIREQQGKRMFVSIDLTSKKLFSSPYFYLAQNDVLYIEPNKTQVNAAAVGANTGVILSAISILLSVVTIFLI